MHPFQGLSAFPITPADADGRIRQADLRRILRHVADAQIDSVCILGSTGGYAYLGPDQRRMTGGASKTMQIDAALDPMWRLFKGSSSFRAVYRAANLLGLADAQPPPPILPLPPTQDDALREAMEALAAI